MFELIIQIAAIVGLIFLLYLAFSAMCLIVMTICAPIFIWKMAKEWWADKKEWWAERKEIKKEKEFLKKFNKEKENE